MHLTKGKKSALQCSPESAVGEVECNECHKTIALAKIFPEAVL